MLESHIHKAYIVAYVDLGYTLGHVELVLPKIMIQIIVIYTISYLVAPETLLSLHFHCTISWSLHVGVEVSFEPMVYTSTWSMLNQPTN